MWFSSLTFALTNPRGLEPVVVYCLMSQSLAFAVSAFSGGTIAIA
jgi:hypothetical protein